jgi:two-component system alkaline phosphatase synthesis response regulator PhoP
MKSKREETVLIIEDDAGLCLGLTKVLRSHGYRVRVAKTGPEGVAMDSAEPPDLVLLDVMLPGMNGFEVCEALRRRDPDLPIVFLSAKGEEEDRVRGLRLGGDDYIVKPFGLAELLARIDAALRRRRLDVAEPVTVGRLVIDFSTHAATCDGADVEMTVLEMKLLAYLLRHEGSLLPRSRILSAVWGADYFGTDRTVDNFINRLRTKIEPDPKEPVHLETVRGGGYRLQRIPRAVAER